MSSSPHDIRPRLELACRAAREAGRLTVDYFGRADLAVDRKGDDSPVTEADREAERLIRARIAEAFPDDAIVGEELGRTDGTSGYQWVVDPIDGTKSFISGVPLYTTLVGLMVAGRSIVGVIYAPALDEMVHAGRGEGAWHTLPTGEVRPARVSSVRKMTDALFVTTDIAGFVDERSTDSLPTFLRLQRAARLTRTWGDAYGYLLVATGRADVMVDPALNLWDAAALSPILDEAGGSYTDWKGQPDLDAGEGLGTNGHLLDEVLRILDG